MGRRTGAATLSAGCDVALWGFWELEFEELDRFLVNLTSCISVLLTSQESEEKKSEIIPTVAAIIKMISPPQLPRIRIPETAMPTGCFSPHLGPQPVSALSPRSPCRPQTSPSPRMRKLMLTLPLAGHMVRTNCHRRHSWHPGVLQCSLSQCGQRSVSLEALDPVEMEKVQCGSLKKRDPRRAPITDYAEDLESLLSLNEEEEGSGSQVFSFQEVKSPLQKYSMSVPSLCITPCEPGPSLTKQRPHSHAQAHSSLSSLLGGSTQRLMQSSVVSLGTAKRRRRARGFQTRRARSRTACARWFGVSASWERWRRIS
ncbi:rho guanine nucleotide exchange factor 2-like isoform X1, partial [Clarias magur]